MAKFNVVGFADVERALLRRDKSAAEAAPMMLISGAAVLTNAQRAEIKQMGLVDTGDMLKSVKPTHVKKTSDGSVIEVYPQGTDRKGVRNAEKAFIAEYGKSGVRAKPWMSSANAKCADAVHKAMRDVWEAKHNE